MPVRLIPTQVVLFAVIFVRVADVAGSVTQHFGVIANPVASPQVAQSFVQTTSHHRKERIDFEDGNFNMSPFGPAVVIPTNHYAGRGVQLLNLEARDVTGSGWTHDPPVVAWHTGFPAPLTVPYSFEFIAPVASFGAFLTDVDAGLFMTVTTTAGQEGFVASAQGGSSFTRFHGFTADTNLIRRVDIFSTDYHLIDDVQFGFVPEPGSILVFAAMIGVLKCRRRAGV